MSNGEHGGASPRGQAVVGRQPPLWLQLLIRHFPRRDFVVGGLIPLSNCVDAPGVGSISQPALIVEQARPDRSRPLLIRGVIMRQ
jgi:hypothetical protein